ncbi:hypothetical protein M0812_11674 [Anaeramoeba flamelloides]|uniref:Uncharacterized protein n=1 Tax=Anaeramoeba flamelloides TaxID=1746091 RepID=A0AAV7ZZ87_9EUKA|nr:hypothetical protein M0812_11674 [Anaeramoeba flamelloides]
MSKYYNENGNYRKYNTNRYQNIVSLPKNKELNSLSKTVPLYEQDNDLFSQTPLSLSKTTTSVKRTGKSPNSHRATNNNAKMQSNHALTSSTTKTNSHLISASPKNTITRVRPSSPYKVIPIDSGSTVIKRKTHHKPKKEILRSVTPTKDLFKNSQLSTQTTKRSSPTSSLTHSSSKKKPKKLTVRLSNHIIERYDPNEKKYRNLNEQKTITSSTSSKSKLKNNKASPNNKPTKSNTNSSLNSNSNTNSISNSTSAINAKTNFKTKNSPSLNFNNSFSSLSLHPKKQNHFSSRNLNSNYQTSQPKTKYDRPLTPQTFSSYSSIKKKKNEKSLFLTPNPKSLSSSKRNRKKENKNTTQDRYCQTPTILGSDYSSFNSNSKTIIYSEIGIQTSRSSFPWKLHFSYINIKANNGGNENDNAEKNGVENERYSFSSLNTKKKENILNSNPKNNSSTRMKSQKSSYSPYYISSKRPSHKSDNHSSFQQTGTEDFLTHPWFEDELDETEFTSSRMSKNQNNNYYKNKNKQYRASRRIWDNKNQNEQQNKSKTNRRDYQTTQNFTTAMDGQNKTKQKQIESQRKHFKSNKSSRTSRSNRSSRTSRSNRSSRSSRSSHSNRKSRTGRTKVHYVNRKKSGQSRNPKYNLPQRIDRNSYREYDSDNLKSRSYYSGDGLEKPKNTGRRDPLSKILTRGNFDRVENNDNNNKKREYKREYGENRTNDKNRKHSNSSSSTIRKPKVQAISHNSQDYSHNRWLEFSMAGPDPNKKTEITSSYSGSAFSEISSYRSTDEDKKFW